MQLTNCTQALVHLQSSFTFLTRLSSVWARKRGFVLTLGSKSDNFLKKWLRIFHHRNECPIEPDRKVSAVSFIAGIFVVVVVVDDDVVVVVVVVAGCC